MIRRIILILLTALTLAGPVCAQTFCETTCRRVGRTTVCETWCM